MKNPTFFKFKLIAFIVLSMFLKFRSEAQTPAARHDLNAKLLPLQSYAETLEKSMDFINRDDFYKGDPKNLLDVKGIPRPAYFFYGELTSNEGLQYENYFTSYPAFHHSVYIRTLIKYYIYRGNKSFLQRAIDLAEWNIENSTPGNYLYGGMPYSTCDKGRMGGNMDGAAIMTDKAAIMARAYVDLYNITENKKFLDAAVVVADCLAKNQRPDGSLPFRVNPETGEVKESYTSSLIYAVELFETLNVATGKDSYQNYRDKAFNWLMNNPVKTAEWRGFYEDVPSGTDNNRTNWDCIDLIRYLCKNKDENPEYMKTALCLLAYIQDSIIHDGKTFIDKSHAYQPAEGLREQKVCFITMGVHSAHLAVMLADLYKATGDETYIGRAKQTMNFITYFMDPNGRIQTAIDDGLYWYSCHFGVDMFLMDFMSSYPELAKDGKNHLVSYLSPVTSIKYGKKEVVYTTKSGSNDALSLAFKPRKILVNGKVLLEGKNNHSNFWEFDERNNVLRISHTGGKVEVK